MKNILNYARLLEIFCYIGIVGSITMTLYTWLNGIPLINHPFNYFIVSYTTDPINLFNQLPAMPSIHRLIGLCIDSIALSIIVYALVIFIRLMRLFKNENFFSINVITHLQRLCTAALAWIIFHPIHGALLSVITSWHNGPGSRVLSISITTYDMINIGIFSFILLIIAIIQKGYELQQERDLTI